MLLPSPLPAAATAAPVEPKAADAASSVTVCYALQARAEPGVMPRVLELFAKRGLVPHKWFSAVAPERSTLAIDVQIEELAPETADYIARSMRQITGVETVLTSEIRRRG
jgi:acetolactate synthase small subunit